MSKILWLASWYPNKTDPFNGDFIQRQAKAVSLYQPVEIIFVTKYNAETRTANPVTPIHTERLNENILYYTSSGSGLISRIRSLYRYFKCHLNFIRSLRKKNEMPDLVHVHVAMKSGLIALYLKRKYGIPYILTEHWSGYYQQAGDSLFRKSRVEKMLTRRIIKNAERLLPVSQALGKQINDCWAEVPFQKIPNTVDKRLFYPAEKRKPGPFRFIHISSLLYPKNPEGIIRTFLHLLRTGTETELILVGPLNPSVSAMLTEEIMAPGKIRTTGEISYERVGQELRNADALILFSFYENMPCVMLEALCTGIPVIAPDLGGIREVLRPENGILLDEPKEPLLFQAMLDMMANYKGYEQQEISRQASDLFSFEKIGKEISQIYEEILGKIHQR